MKLEYLAGGSPDCPLIRLYDFTAAEAGQLVAAIAGLATDAVQRVDVHQLAFVRSLNECRLTIVGRSWDQAVVRVGPAAFECGFTAGTWDNIVGLVAPLTANAVGFQWVAGSPEEANLLPSPSGGVAARLETVCAGLSSRRNKPAARNDWQTGIGSLL